jgi:hypothetical protein
MSDPLNYREPGVPEPVTDRTQRARGTLIVGASVFLISVFLLFLPLLIPMRSEAKYVIAISFVGAGVGFSIAVNGAIDWWRGR